MFRLFRHYISRAALLVAFVDFVALLLSAEIAWTVRAYQIGMTVSSLGDRWEPAIVFATTTLLAMIAVGVYSPEAMRSRNFALMRILTGVSLAVILLSTLYFLMPTVALWRSNLAYAMPLSIVLTMLVRFAARWLVPESRFRRRILVMGAGKRAARLGALEGKTGASFVITEFVRMADGERTIANARPRQDIATLREHVSMLGAEEVVLAIEERRGSLPLQDLLRVKTTGVQVSDIATFLERETGRIDLATVNPSSLIFSDGFTAGQRLSKFTKRAFDIVVSVLVLVLTLPVMLVAGLAVALDSRGGVFYRQERVGLYGETFDILKLRTMRVDAESGGSAVWAAQRDPRITRVGRLLRVTRLDEVPQLINVLRGEMSFVGPRPERPIFVDQLVEAMPFYAERHMVKPGLTGWAQINYPYGASIEDARHKLEYDLYYVKNYTPFLDMTIILQTIRVVMFPQGAR